MIQNELKHLRKWVERNRADPRDRQCVLWVTDLGVHIRLRMWVKDRSKFVTREYVVGWFELTNCRDDLWAFVTEMQTQKMESDG